MKEALKHKHLPIFKYPTNTVLIDDDPAFISSVSSLLDTTIVSEFTNPKAAQKYILDNEGFKPCIKDFLKIMPANDIEEMQFCIRYSELFQNIQNKTKNNISTVIVDYDMPGLDGISLCESIMNTNITKILLSGNINDAKIIDSFNQGFIDYYLSKDSPNLIDDLNQIIEGSNELYFHQISLLISQCLDLDNKRSGYIDTPQFNRFFRSFLKSKGIIEYYLISPYGYYLMKNNHGEVSYLYTCKGDEFNYALEILPDMVDKEILQGIQNKKLLLVNPEEEITLENVRNMIHKCERIPGPNEIYYAYSY